MYQGLNNKVATLPKKELTLDLPEKPPWWKPTIKSRVYPCNFIKNGLQFRGFHPLVLQDSFFSNFGKFYMGLPCNSFTKKVAVLQSIDNLYCRSSFFFFYLGFPSQPSTNHRSAGEGRGYFLNFHPLHRHLDISLVITHLCI